ncbi:MAG: prepilin-type N-terminal cleavage/methylation domain-containing protein [Myxococcota bacterium]|nr:prepilin-type N-terminal cleavage/methylation domain-containing protein [Myxococcota bacterium]
MKHCPAHNVRESGRNAGRGFTLVEMVITVAIVGMVVGVVAVAADNTTRAELRKQSGVVASTMRAAYDSAALSGQTYRLVFAIGDPKKNDKQAIRVEASPEMLVFDPETSTLSRALAGSGGGSLSWDEFATMNAPTGGVDAKAGFAALDGPAASAIDKVLGTGGRDGARANSRDDDDEEEEGEDTGFKEAAKTVDVDLDVRLLSIWTEGMDKPVDAGEAYIYFFPNGYTQDAIVHLQTNDDDKRVISIRLAPLTGKPTITDGYVEAP